TSFLTRTKEWFILIPPRIRRGKTNVEKHHHAIHTTTRYLHLSSARSIPPQFDGDSQRDRSGFHHERQSLIADRQTRRFSIIQYHPDKPQRLQRHGDAEHDTSTALSQPSVSFMVSEPHNCHLEQQRDDNRHLYLHRRYPNRHWNKFCHCFRDERLTVPLGQRNNNRCIRSSRFH